MEIYDQEIVDGLESSIASAQSISYASLVEKSEILYDKKSPHTLRSIAGITDKDLYYTQSILVTTSWNKNDDIFDKSEVWLSKNTPAHKPTNLEHDEAAIVGHITSNYPMTEDNILIDENTPLDNLPEKFHILTGSVIYLGYTNPELKERASKLVAEIENGQKYVSMECFFTAFDYGLINKTTGEYKVLARNAETAFLTKHLRAYGGIGEHEDYKIGRVLRNITFSGKGFVDRPANPESIIFNQNNLILDKQIANHNNNKEKNDTFSNIGVFSDHANEKELIMNLDLQPVMTEVAEIKTKLDTVIAASDLEDRTSQLENTIKAHESKIVELSTALELALSEKEEAAKKDNEKEEELKKTKAELEDALNSLAAYKDKEAEMMKKEKKMKRMASLIENGLDNEEASSTADKFESLDDSAFEAITNLVAAMKIKKKTMASEKTEKEDVSEVLENAEPEKEIDLSVGGEIINETENTRAALVDFVYNRLGKTLNKGE